MSSKSQSKKKQISKNYVYKPIKKCGRDVVDFGLKFKNGIQLAILNVSNKMCTRYDCVCLRFQDKKAVKEVVLIFKISLSIKLKSE